MPEGIGYSACRCPLRLGGWQSRISNAFRHFFFTYLMCDRNMTYLMCDSVTMECQRRWRYLTYGAPARIYLPTQSKNKSDPSQSLIHCKISGHLLIWNLLASGIWKSPSYLRSEKEYMVLLKHVVKHRQHWQFFVQQGLGWCPQLQCASPQQYL